MHQIANEIYTTPNLKIPAVLAGFSLESFGFIGIIIVFVRLILLTQNKLQNLLYKCTHTFCKFLYMYEDYGVQGCVGCGRCIEVCPVNIDIVEMLYDVRANAEAEVEVTAQV